MASYWENSYKCDKSTCWMKNKSIFPLEAWAQVQNFQKDSINSYSGWVSLLISLLPSRKKDISHILVAKTEGMG